MNRLLLLGGRWAAILSRAWRQRLAAPAKATYAVSAPSFEGETKKTSLSSRECPTISYGLNSALAARGVIVHEKAFQNLTPSELQQKGAIVAEPLSKLPICIRGSILGESLEISKAQFSRLLKQVTNHISSISNIFVHDGAIGSFRKIDAKVRVISDSSSAVYPFSNFLWKTSGRGVSHDSCPITVYAASSISSSVAEALGLRNQGNNGFLAADTERSSLILCGKAFVDAWGTKKVLACLAGPIISSRGGLLLPARLLVCCDSLVLLFPPEDTLQGSDLLVSTDGGVILSSHGVSPLFQNGNPGGQHPMKLPAALILVTSDSIYRTIPPVSKLSPGQAASHFLTGYQKGKFIPAYSIGLSSIGPVELAKALLSKEKCGDVLKLVESALKEENIASFKPKVGEGRSGKLEEIHIEDVPVPEEFSF